MTRALPVARHALRHLVLVAALLAGVLCLLGAVTLDVARAAGAVAVRDAGDRSAATGPQASAGRGTAESAPHGVRTFLRAALAGTGPSLGGDPEHSAGGAATALPALRTGEPTAAPAPDRVTARSAAGLSDRAPPRTAGT